MAMQQPLLFPEALGPLSPRCRGVQPGIPFPKLSTAHQPPAHHYHGGVPSIISGRAAGTEMLGSGVLPDPAGAAYV